jgi:hypothetical protein
MSVTTWRLAYSTTLASATTSVTISSLDGNTDVVYRLKIVSEGVGTGEWLLYLNNDSGSNYGFQFLKGVNATASAYRAAYTGMYMAGDGLNTNRSQFEGLIYAKSGYLRTMISDNAGAIATTTVNEASIFGNSWNNTADNLTSIVINGGGTEKMGVGTVIELWKPAEWTAPITSTWVPKVYMFS